MIKAKCSINYAIRRQHDSCSPCGADTDGLKWQIAVVTHVHRMDWSSRSIKGNRKEKQELVVWQIHKQETNVQIISALFN